MEAIRLGSGTCLYRLPTKVLRAVWLRGHLVQGFLHGIVAVRVEDGDHPVYAATLQQFPYAEVVGVYLPEREQPVGIGIISFQYLQRLFVQGYPDGLRLTFLRLLRHVFQKAVLDIVPCETVKVTHTAADIAVEHEDVTDDGQLRVVVQVCVIQDVSFFGSEDRTGRRRSAPCIRRGHRPRCRNTSSSCTSAGRCRRGS